MTCKKHKEEETLIVRKLKGSWILSGRDSEGKDGRRDLEALGFRILRDFDSFYEVAAPDGFTKTKTIEISWYTTPTSHFYECHRTEVFDAAGKRVLTDRYNETPLDLNRHWLSEKRRRELIYPHHQNGGKV